ncbi:SpaH/EbpB family LPXTG-anchored major pilin [Agathobacter sp.]
MKKIKKMLAGLLGAAMVLTSFGTPAWASPAESVTTDATINTTLKGSITIHKYEYNGTGGEFGTGETTDETAKVPNDAKPLAGAGFTIYKVANATEIEKYYSKNPTDLPNVSTYITDGKISSTYSNKVVKLDENGAASDQGTKEELITDADGTASFTNLDVGFYVVIETKTPDKVTTPADPFIVSVPMTKADGSDWLYDVHVYPKNKTTYGNVNLVKTGNSTDKLGGVKFVLQKQTEVTQGSENWVTVKASDQDSTISYENLVTSATDGKISVSGLSQGTYRFIETDRGANYGYIMDGATEYKFVVGADGTTYQADGTTAWPENTITVDNKKPDMKKEVQDRSSKKWQQDSDYNVGDKVPYKVTIDVPENITKLKYFTLKDTPTNLKDDKDTIKVQYKEKNAEDTTLSDVTNTSYSVTQNVGEKGFLVTFTPSNMDAYAGKQIVITYSAELLASADKTTIGNPNTARLEYSNSIVPDTADTDNPNPQEPEPKHDSIEDTAIVYYFAVNIHKTDNDGTPLKDVEFDLYKKVADGVAGAVSVNGIDGKCAKINTNSLKTGTDGDGNVTQGGLANGEYYLVETKTNEGYNLLKSPVKVDLNIQYKTTFTEKNEWIWEDDATTGGKILVKHTVKQTTYTEGTQGNSTTLTDGTHTETIINRKGFTLPKTGDIGTAMFLIIGIGGMLAAVYIMLRGRKRA